MTVEAPWGCHRDGEGSFRCVYCVLVCFFLFRKGSCYVRNLYNCQFWYTPSILVVCTLFFLILKLKVFLKMNIHLKTTAPCCGSLGGRESELGEVSSAIWLELCPGRREERVKMSG